MSSKNNLIIFIFSLFFSTLGFIIGNTNFFSSKPTFTELRQKQNYQFINPLIECESSSFSKTAALQPLRNDLIDTINQLTDNHQISHASIYYRDLNNGPWIGINQDDNFSPASLVKVPLMITYFKASETDPNLLQKIITFDTPIQNQQNITPAVTLDPKQSYTIEELINRMIIYSDNQAYQLLQDNIDNQLLVNTYTDLGIDISKAYDDPAGNIISVRSYAAFFRILYNASYLNKDLSEKALKLLSQVKYTDGLIKGINDPKITIAHKFGERTYDDTGEKQLHDCGIVYLPDKPYLICIMTRGNDFATLSASITQISQLIHKSIP